MHRGKATTYGFEPAISGIGDVGLFGHLLKVTRFTRSDRVTNATCKAPSAVGGATEQCIRAGLSTFVSEMMVLEINR